MTGFITRFNALTKKELKDMMKNKNVFFMFLLPLLFAFIFSKLTPGNTPESASVVAIYMGIIMVGIYVTAMIVAEEKEKNTLKVLMLSPATPFEVLLGKSFITFVILLIISVLVTFITGAGLGNAPIFFVTILISSIFTIGVGLIIGLLSPNMMATGVVGFPIYIILMMVPLLSQGNSEVIKKISEFIPTFHTGEALFKGYNNAPFSEIYKHLLILAISAAASLILFIILYKKKGLEK